MTKKEEALFQNRLTRHIDELRWLYMELYGNDAMFAELCDNLYRFAVERSTALKKRDLEREADPEWYRANDLTGMMLYIDNFAGDLEGVRKKRPYIEQNGVNMLHNWSIPAEYEKTVPRCFPLLPLAISLGWMIASTLP